MTNTSENRSMTALRWTLGLVIAAESILTAWNAYPEIHAGGHHGLHAWVRLILGSAEAAGAILFLLPATLMAGGWILLAVFVFALLFKLRTVIAAVLAMRLIIQFIGQAVGVVLLRRRWPAEKLPFKMWLYPLPVILTILGWIWLFLRTGKAVWWGLFVIILGLAIYLVRSRLRREWPFLAPDAGAAQ